MTYLEMWTHSVLEDTGVKLQRGGTAHGKCQIHTGGSLWFAGVTLSLMPAMELQVRDELDATESSRLHELGWYNEIVLGVLDVLMTQPIAPIKQFELVIHSVEIDEIESRGRAFRLAGRNAARNVLEQVGLMLAA